MMINRVGGKNHLVPTGGDQVSQHEVVCMIGPQRTKAAGPLQAVAPHHHGRPQGKLHAFEHLRHQHPGGHLDRHPDGFQPGPETAAYSAIKARDQANALIGERRHHRPQIIRA